jgi:hypothetical protein
VQHAGEAAVAGEVVLGCGSAELQHAAPMLGWLTQRPWVAQIGMDIEVGGTCNTPGL